MSLMTLNDVWPLEDRPLTVDDLKRQPDDGNRYELVDGVLEVSPAPFNDHQRVASRLTVILSMRCPSGLEVLAPVGLNLDEHNHRIPDVAVVRPRSVLPGEFVAEPPKLVVEIASNSTRKRDRTIKRHEYESFGIGSYWIVVPDFERPSLTAFELHAGRYHQVAAVVGDEQFHATEPFPVTIVPRLLVADGEAWKAGLR